MNFINLFLKPSFFKFHDLIDLRKATHPLELSKTPLHYIFFPTLRNRRKVFEIQISQETSITTPLGFAHKLTLQTLFYFSEDIEIIMENLVFKTNIRHVCDVLCVRRDQLLERIKVLQSKITISNRKQKLSFAFALLDKVYFNRHFLEIFLSPEFSYFLTRSSTPRFIPLSKFRTMLSCKRAISLLLLENLLLNSPEFKVFTLAKLYHSLGLYKTFPLYEIRKAIAADAPVFASLKIHFDRSKDCFYRR